MIVEGKGNKGRKKQIVLETAKEQTQVEEIYGYIKEGMRPTEIFSMLCISDANLTQDRFEKLAEAAYLYAKTAIHKDRDYVFQLHMNRYEDIYNKAIELVGFTGRPLDKSNPDHWNAITTKFGQALNALNHKEDLLGLHNKSFVLEFGDNSAVVVEREDRRGEGMPGYDIENLTFEEQIELLALIKDSRTIPIEGIQRVTIKTTKIEINMNTGERESEQRVKNIDQVETHDITFEEMPENVVKKMHNVERVEEIDDEVEVEIDSRPKELPVPKTAKQLSDSIQDKLMKQFKERLKKNRPK